MELRHLEYFLAVAEGLSFTRASERLHVVQSGVSATIRALERELGADLFTRSSREVALTPAGRALLPRARETLDAARAAKDAVNRTRGILRGSVTLGTLTGIHLLDLPELLAELRFRHPGITVKLRAALTGATGLAQQLRDGELDAAFLSLPGSPPGLRTQTLFTEPLVLVVPCGHPLAGAGRVSLAQLAEFPFVDSPPGFGNRMIVDDAFAAAGLARDVALESPDVVTSAGYIRRGLGIGFLIRPLIGDHKGLETHQWQPAAVARKWDYASRRRHRVAVHGRRNPQACDPHRHGEPRCHWRLVGRRRLAWFVNSHITRTKP
jgi:DNA-binding transcriptional LysR family regulator